MVTPTDGVDSVEETRTINVVDGSDSTPPTVRSTSLGRASTTTPTSSRHRRNVVASVAERHLVSWTLALVERGTPSNEQLVLASGSGPVDQAVIGAIDPTRVLNGQWTLRLEGRDASGNVGEDSVALSIEGELKLGHFSITFEDLNVPVAGIPVSVSRTYDTRQRHRNLDFGHGWNVAYQNVRIHESRRPGFAWQLNVYPSGPFGLVPNWCVESALGNVVSVTLPNGDVEKFRAKAFPECNQGSPFLDVELRFAPAPGTEGRLVVLEHNSNTINESLPIPVNLHAAGSDTTDTRRDGPDSLSIRMRRARDPRARWRNVVTLDTRHRPSNGLIVDFVRDSADRSPSRGATSQYDYESTPRAICPHSS